MVYKITKEAKLSTQNISFYSERVVHSQRKFLAMEVPWGYLKRRVNLDGSFGFSSVSYKHNFMLIHLLSMFIVHYKWELCAKIKVCITHSKKGK